MSLDPNSEHVLFLHVMTNNQDALRHALPTVSAPLAGFLLRALASEQRAADTWMEAACNSLQDTARVDYLWTFGRQDVCMTISES